MAASALVRTDGCLLRRGRGTAIPKLTPVVSWKEEELQVCDTSCILPCMLLCKLLCLRHVIRWGHCGLPHQFRMPSQAQRTAAKPKSTFEAVVAKIQDMGEQVLEVAGRHDAQL